MNTTRWATRISVVLVIASLVYIGVQGWEMREHLLSWKPTPRAIILMISGVLLYCLANTPHGLAWQYALNRLANRKVSLLLIFARSQLGKYLPGNVVHIAGRHVMAREHNFPHSSLITSTLVEFSGLLSAAGTIILFATTLPALVSATASAVPIPLHALGLILACAMPGIAVACRVAPARFGLKFSQENSQSTAPSVSFLLLPYFLYLCYFLLAGEAFVFVSFAVSGSVALSHTGILFITFALGWTLGFVSPGAPSGIGIREAVLFYCLKTVLPESDALIISALFRVVTIAGDLVFWLSVEVLHRTVRH